MLKVIEKAEFRMIIEPTVQTLSGENAEPEWIHIIVQLNIVRCKLDLRREHLIANTTNELALNLNTKNRRRNHRNRRVLRSSLHVGGLKVKCFPEDS